MRIIQIDKIYRYNNYDSQIEITATRPSRAGQSDGPVYMISGGGDGGGEGGDGGGDTLYLKSVEQVVLRHHEQRQLPSGFVFSFVIRGRHSRM